MCGFCGFTGNARGDKQVIHTMANTIKHRSRDGMGVHEADAISLGLGLCGVPDAQPVYNEDRSLLIAFNGEIHNAAELREDLLAKGHSFTGETDGEVLLHLYEEEGERLLEHISGLFAFLIYDLSNKTAFAARDFFGIKPFYYAVVDGELVFSSEIKSILEYPGFQKELNRLALEQYLSFQYSVLEETFFKGIYKLLPAHSLRFQNGIITTKQYWEVTFEPDDSKTLEETVEEIDQVVKASVARHQAAHPGLGTFLSSGVDSSYIAATFGGKQAFTVGWDHPNYAAYSEIDYAQSLSAEVGLTHCHKLISSDEYWDRLSTVQYHTDEPLADPAAVALFFLSELASQHVSTVFSGEGADEFFAGYTIYKEPIDLRPITRLPMPIRRLLGKLAEKLPVGMKGRSFLIRGSKPVEERFIGNANIFTEGERRGLLKSPTTAKTSDVTKPYYDKVQHLNDTQKMQYIDIHLWGPGDILLKADKTSMAHGLEIRSPLLDREVFRVASKIPTKLLVTQETTKYAFRLAAKKHLPPAVAQKKKLGFPVPTRLWLREDRYYERVKAAFESERAKEFFHTAPLLALLADHKSGKADNSRKIWTVYVFLVWYDVFFGETPTTEEAAS